MKQQFKVINRKYFCAQDHNFFFEIEINNNDLTHRVTYLASDLYQNKFVMSKLSAEEREDIAYFAGYEQARAMISRVNNILKKSGGRIA